MKKSLIAFFILAFGFTLLQTAHAQSTDLQKAVEGVQNRLDDLVTAKDESGSQTLDLRIATFGKVIDLSLAEAKDLKVRLLTADNLSDEITAWQNTMVGQLTRAIEYLGNEKQNLADRALLDLNDLKSMAQDFKNWRDGEYLPYANQVRDFFLVRREENAVQVATTRLRKISDDVKKLERARIKNVEQLTELLGKASDLVKDGQNINSEVQNLFWEEDISPIVSTSTATSTTGNASSTGDVATTSSPTSTITVFLPLISTSTTSSTNATSSETNGSPELQPTSIKELAEESLAKVRGAYQVFIEMSNLVRNLLK